MKKGLLFGICFLVLCFCISSVCAESSSFDSSSLLPLTQKTIEIKHDRYSWIKHNIKFIIIHHNTSVKYEKNNTDLEDELKKHYDLVFVEIPRIPENNSFSLYDFKTNTILKIGQDEYKSIDFYDFSIIPAGTSYFSDVTFSYLASGYVTILGYLLFPKVISDDTVSAELVYKNDSITWDLDKINKMIAILSD